MDLKETYNQIAEDWNQDHLKDDWFLVGINKYLSLFKPGALLLDIGCAGGLKVDYMIKRGFKVVGVDFSEKMIEIAKRDVPEGEFYTLGLEDVDQLKGEFDGISLMAVLLHVPKQDVPKRLIKIVEKLKKGGYLYISVKEIRAGNAAEEIKTENDYGYDYQRFFSYFTTEEVEKYMKDLGLEIVFSDVSLSGKTNWIQVIGKK